MPPTSPNQQAYPGLSAFADPQHQMALRAMWDRIHSIEGRGQDTGVTFRANPNLGGTATSTTKGLQVKNAADPTDQGDYVTLRYLKAQLTPQQLATTLSLGNPALANLTTFLLTGATVITGTHAQRLATQPTAGAIFVELDRGAFYRGTTNQWLILGCVAGLTSTFANFPSDLGAADAGFTIDGTDTGLQYIWSGNIWHQHRGMLVDLFANRPVAFTGTDTGLLFAASDLGYQQWYLNFATGFWTFVGGGRPAPLTIATLPVGLTANDVGFLANATDFDRLYVWTGSAWTDAPGQPKRGLQFFSGSPGTGWHICDGTVVTISTIGGGTSSFTLPNLIAVFPRGNSVYGGTGGAATATATIPAGTTGNDSGTQTVQSGAGATVPAEPHTHSFGPSTSNAFGILPPYFDLLPYWRL